MKRASEMWSRVVEVMLGCWLIVSPFIFLEMEKRGDWWFRDMFAGLAVIIFALLSYWHPARWTHLLTLAVALLLIGVAYRDGFGDASPMAQNEIILGMLLLMFAIIPNNASDPPSTWEACRRASEV